MPADFGDIASYHRREAIRYAVLAEAARNRGNYGEAEYMANQAARYAEAAHEQQMGMMLEPGRMAPAQGQKSADIRSKSKRDILQRNCAGAISVRV
jgi:hypothetical protein